MAIIHNGILSGKIGSVIMYNDKGFQGMRSLPKKSNKPPTLAQQMQRMRFAMIVTFFTPLKSLINHGFGERRGVRSRSNLCISYHVQHAVTGMFPDLTIDYSKVILTKGKLAGAAKASIASEKADEVIFAWNYHPEFFMGSPTDEAILVVYHPLKHRHVWLRTAATREVQTATLNIPASFAGETLHCWIAFISVNGKLFSNSSYLGTVTVAA
jgi:hypothetical protein